MVVNTIPDIVGNNAVVQLSTVAPTPSARWISFTANTSNLARVGDNASVGPARGEGIGTTPLNWRSTPDQTDLYNFRQIGVYAPSGTTVSITYGQ